MKKVKRILLIVLVLAVFLSMMSMLIACTSDHAPGYGQTSKCTICGKAATHKTGSYGFCDKHWDKATNR